MRVGVLASGYGSNLGALCERGVDVVAVGSDKPDAYALQRARERNIPTAVFPRADYADRAARDTAMADWLDEHGVELVVSAGYMQLLSPAFLRRFPDRVINVHPSLLPAFPGLRAVEQALAHGVKVFGVTVHYLDEGVDTGRIIAQRAVELPDATTPDEVMAALRPLEHDLLCSVVLAFDQ
jgi:phosphoribosylglycinamide formyltransferase-1